ncbi:MAG: hypothetical protein MJD61_22140, partial [Proteobacteria bacterium]|nr:hypothetical protein [Pseudomonadota bacterium]
PPRDEHGEQQLDPPATICTQSHDHFPSLLSKLLTQASPAAFTRAGKTDCTENSIALSWLDRDLLKELGHA